MKEHCGVDVPSPKAPQAVTEVTVKPSPGPKIPFITNKTIEDLGVIKYPVLPILKKKSFPIFISGIERVIQCHGSFANATCMRCKASYSCEDVRADIFAQIVPRCHKCAHVDDQQPQPSQIKSSATEISTAAASCSDLAKETRSFSAADTASEQTLGKGNADKDPDGVISTVFSETPAAENEQPSPYPTSTADQSTPSPPTATSDFVDDATGSNALSRDLRQYPANVIKPDIVFFGESLPELFHQRMAKDKDVCDLLIVIGSSLKVRPVALIPNSISPQIPQVALIL